MLVSASGPTIASSPGRTSPPGITNRTEGEAASAIAACSDSGITVNLRPVSARAVSTTVVPLSSQPPRRHRQIGDRPGDAFLGVHGLHLAHRERQFLSAHQQVHRSTPHPPRHTPPDQQVKVTPNRHLRGAEFCGCVGDVDAAISPQRLHQWREQPAGSADPPYIGMFVRTPRM
jgi:hypothetical protein